MSANEERTFSLSAEQAAFIDRQVASGAFATASEVVEAGLNELQDREAGFEQWLREEVAPTYDEVLANPEQLVSLAEAIDEIRAIHKGQSRRGS